MVVWGTGDFTAGMMSTLTVEGDPVSYSMGAGGENVHFWAEGAQGMSGEDCTAAGYFIAGMYFYDPGCGCPRCPCPT